MKPLHLNAKDTSALFDLVNTIHRTAMEHPCFCPDEYWRRDIAALCDMGGDACDWTMIAIRADDALKILGQE